ncbi:MAG: coproporphyrinogen dehydrogenase HemZ [Eubacteriales bacterium]|nr:coproporphyrinogen dehydrogenase HemZ [Eubacteriales bacterium]
MTTLNTDTPAFFSDICEVIRLFVDTRKIARTEAGDTPGQGFCVLHSLSQTDGMVTSTAGVYTDGDQAAAYTYRCDAGQGVLEQKRAAKRAAKISVYRALNDYFGTDMPWGSLTGIRPTKLLRDSQTRLGKDGARALFLNEFDVSRGKYDFAKGIVDAQAGLLPDADCDIDVYIGIPFCVTRCAYCSFSSNTPDVFSGAEDKYMDALMSELDMAEELLSGRNVRAVYIGGGTPTALSAKNLEKVAMRAAGIGKGALEFTVEAGRPDTITDEKLDIIKSCGASRISVNTQTLLDKTLVRIGRAHTAAQFFEAYRMAQHKGFDAINVDIIAGLPGETADDAAETLRSIIGLDPENITVHTLSIKRASKFATDNMDAFPTDTETAGMLERARGMLERADFHAYYMYRQKYMKGSLENAGYARGGKACLYNIDNMEELCGVIAFGAGGISKRIFSTEGRIERAANIKDLREYIARPAEMCARKRALFGQADRDVKNNEY